MFMSVLQDVLRFFLANCNDYKQS